MSKVQVTCLNCLKDFQKHKAQIKKYPNNFCSSSCSASYWNKIKPKRVKKINTCPECNKSFEGENKYCSIKCFRDNQFNISLSKVLTGESSYSSVQRKVLVKLKGNNCEICSLENKWCNKSLVLQVDHIDGNSDNNKIENLRLLCPNCHSQTETFTSKIKKNSKRSQLLQRYRTCSS